MHPRAEARLARGAGLLFLEKWALEAHFFLLCLMLGRRASFGAGGRCGRDKVLAVASVVGEWVARVERTVEGLGYELVDVEREGHGLLRVTIDVPPPAAGVTVDDCERVSRQLTHMFAVEDVDYDRLEVSSPGLDRPLKKARDFRRFEGAEIQLQLSAALDGRRRWRGTVLAVTGDAGSERVQLAVTPEEEAKEPVRRVRPVGNPGAGGKGGRAAAKTRANAPAEQRKIEFAVAEVDRARLVPVLDFRSKQ